MVSSADDMVEEKVKRQMVTNLMALKIVLVLTMVFILIPHYGATFRSSDLVRFECRGFQ